MYDYRGKKDMEKYVLNYIIDEDNNIIHINYADKVQNVEYNEVNIEILDKIMEEQMKDAICNKKKFVLNRNVSAALVFGSSLATALPLPLYGSKESTAVFGVLVVSTAAVFLNKLVKNNDKLDEIRKAEYYYEHRDMLDNMKNYSNYKDNVRLEFNQLLNEDRPFVVNNYEKFEIDDLENIVSNIVKEKEYKNIYIKK